MVDSVDELRDAIVGAPQVPKPAAERRRRFRSGRRRRIVLIIGGATLLAASAAVWAWGSILTGPAPAHALAIGTVGAAAGGAPDRTVMRAPAPVLPPAPAPSHRHAAVAPPPVAVPGARAPGDEPGLALSGLFGGWSLPGSGGIVAPVAIARRDWAQGACAARSRPAGPAYCAVDRRLYARAEVARETGALLGLAHQIGAHVEAELGLALDPAEGEAQALRRDCLAGFWARHAGPVRTWLYPERVALILDPESRGGWGARRAAAFRDGYLAARPIDCNRVALAG